MRPAKPRPEATRRSSREKAPVVYDEDAMDVVLEEAEAARSPGPRRALAADGGVSDCLTSE